MALCGRWIALVVPGVAGLVACFIGVKEQCSVRPVILNERRQDSSRPAKQSLARCAALKAVASQYESRIALGLFKCVSSSP
jgi:hypothetical protein